MERKQLDLFSPPAPEPDLVPAPTRAQVEDACQLFIMDGDRAGLVAYLNELCHQGKSTSVQRLCRLRRDFGLKVENGSVTEFFQIGDIVQIAKSGQFYGKYAGILALENGIATVRAETWVVDHRYSVAELFLIRRKPANS